MASWFLVYLTSINCESLTFAVIGNGEVPGWEAFSGTGWDLDVARVETTCHLGTGVGEGGLGNGVVSGSSTELERDDGSVSSLHSRRVERKCGSSAARGKTNHDSGSLDRGSLINDSSVFRKRGHTFWAEAKEAIVRAARAAE